MWSRYLELRDLNQDYLILLWNVFYMTCWKTTQTYTTLLHGRKVGDTGTVFADIDDAPGCGTFD